MVRNPGDQGADRGAPAPRLHGSTAPRLHGAIAAPATQGSARCAASMCNYVDAASHTRSNPWSCAWIYSRFWRWTHPMFCHGSSLVLPPGPPQLTLACLNLPIPFVLPPDPLDRPQICHPWFCSWTPQVPHLILPMDPSLDLLVSPLDLLPEPPPDLLLYPPLGPLLAPPLDLLLYPPWALSWPRPWTCPACPRCAAVGAARFSALCTSSPPMRSFVLFVRVASHL